MASQELVPVKEYSALANFDRTLSLIQTELQGQQLTEFNLARVKMAAGGAQFWQVPGLTGVETVPMIEGVVLHSKFTRSYWEKTYTGGNEPPDCSSPDAMHATPRPDVDIPAPADPDRPDGLLCNGCAFAEWGSATRDGKPTRGQACKMSRVLFVLNPQRKLPLVVVLPPTSLKPAQTYFLTLADYDKDHREIVTRIGLVKQSGQGVPDYSAATFEAAGEVPADLIPMVHQYADTVRGAFDRVQVERSDIENG